MPQAGGNEGWFARHPQFRGQPFQTAQPMGQQAPQPQYSPIAAQEPVPQPQNPFGAILGQQAGWQPEDWQARSNARLYGRSF